LSLVGGEGNDGRPFVPGWWRGREVRPVSLVGGEDGGRERERERGGEGGREQRSHLKGVGQKGYV